MSFDPWFEQLRRLRKMSEAVAEECAADVGAAARATARAGTSPAGETWVPTKQRKAPLQRAAEQIKVSVLGAVVKVYVTGHHALHSLGIGNPLRPIVPENGQPMPDSYAVAIAKAADRVWGRVSK